jgi:hypothetical protein
LSPRVRIGESATLEPRDFISHVHGVGLSRTGKSKLIELIVRDFVTKAVPFCLIDPHGTLIGELLDWLVVMRFDRNLTLLDARRNGFNPWALENPTPARVMTKTDRLVSATLMAWGTDPNAVPRLSKFLAAIYYLLLENQLPISAIDTFLDFERGREREELLERTQSDWIRRELARLYAMNRTGYEAYLESTGNRLRMFAHPTVRRMLSGSLDLRDTIDSRGMVLVNLQPTDELSQEAGRVIGTLLVNEIWDVTYGRERPKEFYVVLDECHRFMTPDIGSILAEGAKYGLHLLLFHQDRSQVKPFEGALKNAQTKLWFSTEEEPLPARHFILRRADHEEYPGVVLPVTSFRVPREERERLIESLIDSEEPPVLQNHPVEPRLPPMTPQPPLEYDPSPESLLGAFKYLTAEQLETLTGKSNQVVRRAMLGVKCDVKRHQGKNVYCYPEKGRKHENLAHELGITDVHIKLYQAGILTRWEQSGLREYENPDAFFAVSLSSLPGEGINSESYFFLEYQQSNPSEPPQKKAKRYDRMATEGRHRALAQNFRVLFVVQTGAKADNLARTFAGLPNPCRFWVADLDLTIRCAKHQTHTILVSNEES